MSLRRYIQDCYRQAEELASELDAASVDALRDRLAAIPGREEWWRRFRETAAQAIDRYVGETPAKRRRLRNKSPFSDGDWACLVLAGIQHCLEAADLLSAIESSDLTPGGPYRHMAVRAGQAFRRLEPSDRPPWSFDDPDPFGES